MRPLSEMQTIQIELTSACVLRCSNCTRFCGTHKVPFFLEEDKFKEAINSLVGYSALPNATVGFMGGEPLLHPKFSEFCEYALTKIPREKLGLWTTLPDLPKLKGYAEIICRTFANILINDHSRGDILHAPILMAAEDYMSDEAIWTATEHCWVQESWSASINPKGAWFCEVAGALSDLFDGPDGWPVEEKWWMKTTKDFTAQREWACRKCGAALPIKRVRNSQDEHDDVSKSNYDRLVQIKSKKIDKQLTVVHDAPEIDPELVKNHGYPAQTYKDIYFRQRIANRYGIWLSINARGYCEPRLMTDGEKTQETRPIFEILKETYGGI